MIEILVILTLALVLGILFPTLRGRRRGRPKAAPGKPRNCPLCGSALAAGERVKSASYRAPPGGEDRIHLLECPHCGAARGLPRRCPVCRCSLPGGGYLVAAMWREKNKTRVHVLGCSICRDGRSPDPLRQ